MMTLSNIIIVDDHSVVRRGLSQIVQLCSGFKVIAEFSSGEELIEYMKVNYFSTEEMPIILLDMTLQHLSGQETMAILLKMIPELRIIFISMQDESQFALKLIYAGAMGFISKEADMNTICSAVKKVGQGHRYFSDAILNQLIDSPPVSINIFQALSKREIEILDYISDGLTIKEISYQLNLSDKTIFAHRDNIKRKLNLKTNNELILIAIKNMRILS